MVVDANKWIVGADDFGTETQECDGWTYFALPSNRVGAFEDAGRALLKKHGLNIFHGKKYLSYQKEAYQDFLLLIREELRENAICSSILFSREHRVELFDFARREIPNVISRKKPEYSDSEEMIVPYASVLFSAINILNSLGPNRRVQLFLDEHTSLPVIDEAGEIIALLSKVIEAYRQAKFPSSPVFLNCPVRKIKAKQSILIQAADVLGNLFIALVYTVLGDTSKKRAEKAELFCEVWGFSVSDFDLSSKVELNGKDFKLKEGGFFAFKIGVKNRKRK